MPRTSRLIFVVAKAIFLWVSNQERALTCSANPGKVVHPSCIVSPHAVSGRALPRSCPRQPRQMSINFEILP